MPKHRLIVAGGGTGGHVLAGIAIAQKWVEFHHLETHGNQAIRFVGARGGLEERLVPRAGFRLETLNVGALNRVGLRRIFKTLIQLPVAFLKAFWIVLSMRPDVVIGVGGYSSGPFVWIAATMMRLFGGKTAILEQNTIPGMTNRILAKKVNHVFCAFELDPSVVLGCKTSKPIVTGNPIRSHMRPLPPAKRDPFVIFVFGGSQGAVGMNTLVIHALEHLEDLGRRIRWIHQTGDKDYDRVFRAHQTHQTGARVERFIDDMLAAYSEASLLICRSGASTLFEIAAVRRAALFVPLPTASDDHQTKNASLFERAGAGMILNQKTSTGEDLARVIRNLVSDFDKVALMEQNTERFFRPDAAQKIVEVLSAGKSN